MSSETQEATPTEVDMSEPESGLGAGARLGTAAAGAALLAFGLRRRSLVGAATALAGGWLLYRGLGGGGRSGDERLDEGAAVERSVTVGEPADELHDLLRDPERLARIAGGVADVTADGDDRQHWVVEGPLGRSVSWDTRVVEEQPGEYLRWESVDGAVLSGEGSVEFRPAPAGRGTEVTLRLDLDSPGGPLGDAALRVFGVVPDAVAGQLLDRFKSLAETGEIQTLERNPSGRGSGDWA